jgi:hypothetical protein
MKYVKQVILYINHNEPRGQITIRLISCVKHATKQRDDHEVIKIYLPFF